MRKVTGFVTVAQEGRFRLATDDGVSRLFVLSGAASMDARDLPGLARDMERVTVHYEDAEGLLADLAHDLTRPDDDPDRRVGSSSAAGGRGA